MVVRKVVPPAAMPAREGRERALVQNQEGVMEGTPLPLRGAAGDKSRLAVFAEAPAKTPHRPLGAVDVGRSYKSDSEIHD